MGGPQAQGHSLDILARISHQRLARISRQLTVEARDRPAITSLRLAGEIAGPYCRRKPGERVKTDRRDGLTPARLERARELTVDFVA